MSRAVLTLANDDIRRRAAEWVWKAPADSRVEFKGKRRSNDQNAKFWAMATDVATQLKWHGLRLTPDDWKLIFLDALRREVRMVPNIDNNGFVSLGRSSSDLSKEEFRDLIELVAAFGANHGIKFTEPTIEDPRAPTPRHAMESA